MKNLVKRGARWVRRHCAAVGAGAGSLVVSVSAMAAAPDVTAITTAITDAGTAAATVASGVLVMIVGIKTYKYIRRAL